MLLNARSLSYISGQPARILLGIQDVTELLRFPAGMRRSEQRYRRLFEASRDGVLLIDPVTRKILDANPFMTELLDYTHEELLGKELFEIGMLEDEVASLAVFRELKGKGFIRYDDLPLETKTGDRRVVEFVSNLYHEYGDEIVQCNIRDVTKRKQAEDARQTLTEKLTAELTATQQLQETSARLIQEGDINTLYQQILKAAMAIMQSDMASMQMIDQGKDATRSNWLGERRSGERAF